MHGGKAILLIVVLALLVGSGVILFVPGLRPGFVKTWFNKAKGYTGATSPSDALDKFKQAIEKREYESASLYLSGEYKEWFDKGRDDAEAVAREIDNLRAAMKKTGVKSDKGQFVLFLVDPFPGNFKFDVRESSGETIAVINWTEELTNYAGQSFAGVQTWAVDAKLLNSLVPRVAALGSVTVTLKKESDGFWRIQFPVQVADRKMSQTVDFLRKNGSNLKNALQGVKNDVKNNPTTKEDFESALKVALDKTK